MKDAKLARQLARATWLVLVASFVLMTRWPLAPSHRAIALGALTVGFVVMNLPVVLGLIESRTLADTKAFRAVAIGLALRIAALIAVIAVIALVGWGVR